MCFRKNIFSFEKCPNFAIFYFYSSFPPKIEYSESCSPFFRILQFCIHAAAKTSKMVDSLQGTSSGPPEDLQGTRSTVTPALSCLVNKRMQKWWLYAIQQPWWYHWAWWKVRTAWILVTTSSRAVLHFHVLSLAQSMRSAHHVTLTIAPLSLTEEQKLPVHGAFMCVTIVNTFLCPSILRQHSYNVFGRKTAVFKFPPKRAILNKQGHEVGLLISNTVKWSETNVSENIPE